MTKWTGMEPGSFTTAIFLLFALGIPGTIASVVGGTGAGMAVGVAGGSALAFSSVSGNRIAVPLAVLVGMAGAAGAAVEGQPLLAALLIAATTLLVGAANQLSIGMLALVPVLAAVFASADRGLSWWAAGGWSLFGAVCGLVLLRVMKGRTDPVPLDSRHAWRHSIVLAATCGLTFYFALAWSLPHGYWITLTLLVALRPLPEERREILSDRLWGTLLGAVGALIVALLLPPLAAQLVALVCLALLGGYAVSGNYFLQTLFLTPMLLLFATAGDDSGALSFTVERVLFTIVGVAIGAALVAVLALWDRADHEPSATSTTAG